MNVKQCLILLFLALMLQGCGSIFPNINPPNIPDTKYEYHQSIDKQPVTGYTQNGRAVIFESQRITTDINLEKKEKPLTLWQKFFNWIAHLGFLGIIISIALYLFFHITPFAILNWFKEKWKKAMVQTVKGIEDFKAVELPKVIENSKAVLPMTVLKESLSSAQDTDVKMLVDDIKRTI